MKTLTALTGVFLAILVITQSFVSGQTGAVVVRPGGPMTVTWNHSGLDINGGPETLDTAEIGISLSTIDLRQGGQALASVFVPCKSGANSADGGALLNGRAQGFYKLWARAYDQAKNVSAWSVPVDILLATVDTVPPTPPSGVSCTVK